MANKLKTSRGSPLAADLFTQLGYSVTPLGCSVTPLGYSVTPLGYSVIFKKNVKIYVYAIRVFGYAKLGDGDSNAFKAKFRNSDHFSKFGLKSSKLVRIFNSRSE